MASLGHRVTGLAAGTPATYKGDGSPERVSDTPGFTQLASGTTGSWFPAVREGEPHLEENKLKVFCSRDTCPRSLGWTFQNPWKMGVEDGWASHRAIQGLCYLSFGWE